jgi:AcrR family transcriptional regulator
MAATGLQKGGIYRHFESKEQLALESFDYAVQVMTDRFRDALDGKRTALERLHAIISIFAEIPTNPPVPGGCPVMNAALENDDGNPALRARARDAMDGLRALVVRVAKGGIQRGEVRREVDPDDLASVLISTLEGAVMLSKLYDDPAHVRRAVAHLERYLDESVRAS